jgi:hypothetical protein
MKLQKLFALFGLCLSVFFLGGCSAMRADAGEEEHWRTAVAAYNPDSLRNYKAGRDFAAAGRFELAREHYLMALASNDDPAMQEALVKELDSIDLIIKSLR